MAVATPPPLVSVICATFNSSALLKLALGSLLDQDLADFEAWVLGDACTDDSAQVIDSFGDPRLHWVNLPHTSGSQAAPNNEGLRRSRGRYIAYLGHDDLWFPWHLSGLVRFLEETRADLAHSLSAVIGPDGADLTLGPPLIGQTYRSCYVPPSSWLHRREIVDDCGLWADPLAIGDNVDNDYLRRVCVAGKRIELCRQLSVLKFPSAWWKSYAADSARPQESYLTCLRQDPEETQRRILLESVTVWTRHLGVGVPARQAFGRAFSTLAHRVIDAYGRERWPLDALLRRRHQRKRLLRRRDRGLVS
ncbi:MAG TPA: glycosyltransferase [Blastocatellia bacterium]|nr:glycosyltransferase [Blastocatellia bacterium]